MIYKVKMGKPQYVLDWINSLNGSKRPSVQKIRKTALNMFENPEKYTCLSEDYIDKIFGKWSHGTTRGGYGFHKCTIRCIRENMFVVNYNCPELAGGEEW